MKLMRSAILFLFFAFSSNYASNAGQFFILTLPGFNAFSDLEPWLEKTRPAGVMLTAVHVKNRDQTKRLCTFLQNKAEELGIHPLLICTDWEGGIVSRPNETGGFNSIPSPHNLGLAGRTSCFLAGQLIGQQMRESGINVDFAPSLDLFDPKNIVLATRCFSDNPEITAECGIALSNGFMSRGIIPVVKHYPGLMLGKTDTHFNDVIINAGEEEFTHNEQPFINAIKKKIPAIMVSHARYSQFGKYPASRSKKVIQRLKKYNPNLVVIADDIAMHAYSGQGGLFESTANSTNVSNENLVAASAQSIRNGFDLLIYTAPPEQQINLIEQLDHLLENKGASLNVAKLKQAISEPQSQLWLNEKEISCELAQRALNQNIRPVEMQDKNILLISVDFPKIRPAESWFARDGQTALAELIRDSGFDCNELILNALNGSGTQELEKLIASGDLDSADLIFVQTFFYGGGIWNTTQEQWLKKLAPYANKIIIFSLGHPFEKLIVAPSQMIELGSFHMPMLKAALNRLNTSLLTTGADKLAQNPRQRLKNKSFGLLCHRCSVVNSNNQTEFLPDFLYRWTKTDKSGAQLCALFAPEHGIFGTKEAYATIHSENKSKWGCPIYSLHGTTKSPTPQMLKNLDLLIVDLQDVGVRCYTYLSTLALTLEAAKKSGVPVLLLERPNPIKFLGTLGPKLNRKFESFVGKVDTQFIHGQTIGQIAKNLNKKIGADLTVLSCEINQKSTDAYFRSNYIPPSPNLPTLDSLLCYPITVFVEGTNYSEGRGTTHPFEQIGAPWVDGKKFAANLNKKKLPGIYFEPISFTPKVVSGKAEKPKHQNKFCHGVFLHIYDKYKLKPVETAQAILNELFRTYPKQSEWIRFEKRYFVDLLAGGNSIRNKASSI